MSLTDPVIVAVVTYNSAHLIPGLVESLERGMGGTAYALVVADNSSSDGSTDVVRSADPSARVVQMGRNAGYAAGLNAAVCLPRPRRSASRSLRWRRRTDARLGPA